MTELALLARAFEAVPEPDKATIAEARGALLRSIADATGRPTRRPRRIRRLRLVLVALALLLLVAGIATATYLGVRTWWVSAGPRGVQYASDYRFSTVFAPADAIEERANFGARFQHWHSFVLDPRGHNLYALHRAAGARLPDLVRIEGVDRGARLRATRVMSLQAFAGPRFRPAWWPRSDADSLAVAPNGDLFLLAAGRDPTSALRLAHGDLALFVLHPNGARQRVLSLGGLIESGVLPNVSGQTHLSLAPTAGDRLWLRAESFEVRRGYWHRLEGSSRLLEIVDPNADGDWADRVVRPIRLPDSVDPGKDSRWFWWELLAEPPLPGDDRARSVLSPGGNIDGRYRVYRIADRDDDGDALDRGEVQLVSHGPAGGMVTPMVLHAGGVAERALALTGIHGFNRISIVGGSGAAKDIARSFPSYLNELLAGPNGDIYPVTQAGTVYRLAPGARGAHAGHPLSAAGSVHAPALPPKRGAAQILFFGPAPANIGIKDVPGPLYAVGADGRGLRKLPHGAAQCFSKDGRMIAFMSDEEIPYEPHSYVANANGSGVRKLPAFPLCPFSTPVLSLWGTNGLAWYDVRTGRGVGTALRFPGGPTLSSDGTRAVYLGKGNPGAESPALRQRPIVVVDLSTRHRRVLGRPAPPSSRYANQVAYTYGLEWSPDGTRIAYVTTLRPGAKRGQDRYVLWVRDVKSGAVIFSNAIAGWTPGQLWSPDGANLLLVCVADRDVDSYFSCAGGAPVSRRRAVKQPSARLLLVDLADRSTRLIAREPLVFHGWAPSGGAFAYATPAALFLRTPDGGTRKLASAPEGQWPEGGSWLGWSPDGRYIGLGSQAPGAQGKLLPLTTVDVRTGQIYIIRTPPRAPWASWWRR